MNKVLLVQVYSCLESKLVKEYRYSMTNGTLINTITKMSRKGDECMLI